MEPTRSAPAHEGAALRPQLRRIRFQVQARIANGAMTVGDLLDLAPGSLLRSDTRAGSRVVLAVGRVNLATAEPFVDAGRLLLRIEETGGPGE